MHESASGLVISGDRKLISFFQVAVSSSAFMVLFTASSTTFQYYLLGRLLPV